jgi:U3 small nucleolar RNA-associated protein 4
MNEASVTSGGFVPGTSNVLIVTTSRNEVYVLDVEAKQLGEWSRRHTHHLPRRFREFPGEVIGLAFPPRFSLTHSSVIVYSSRYLQKVIFFIKSLVTIGWWFLRVHLNVVLLLSV